MNKFILSLTGVLFLSLATPSSATGLMTCDSGDKASWKSKEQLEKKMTAEGWKVRFIKLDGGCYEVYGTSPDGQRVEAYYHPVSLEKMLVARRGKILFRKGE